MTRRTFLYYGTGMLAGSAAIAQRAEVQNGKAVVCEQKADPLKCPNGHWTCESIAAPLAVGGGTYQNPETAPLFAYTLLRCNTCHVLFTRE